MRLTDLQIQQIKEQTLSIYGTSASVYLFGSRTDEKRKGPDIDIFIQTPKSASLMDKLKLISLLQMKMGEQKIDIVVKSPASKHRSIFDTAKNEGIKLC